MIFEGNMMAKCKKKRLLLADVKNNAYVCDVIALMQNYNKDLMMYLYNNEKQIENLFK